MVDKAAGQAEGRRILVVEDDYFIAYELRYELEELGARVLGPVASVSAALRIIASGEEIDGVTLDVSLGREKAFPVADALRARNVPFVFVTGYDDWAIPEDYRDAPRCTKPTKVQELIASLLR